MLIDLLESSKAIGLCPMGILTKPNNIGCENKILCNQSMGLMFQVVWLIYILPLIYVIDCISFLQLS